MSEIQWNKKLRQAVFNEDGSLENYLWTNDLEDLKEEGKVRDVTQPFYMELELDSWGRGRSSALFYFKQVKKEAMFPMFMSDFFDLVSGGHIKGKPILKGYWQVVKKGANYGIKFTGTENVK